MRKFRHRFKKLDRADYEIERLSEQSYNLSVEISGLEFKLSKLEEN